MTQFELSQPDTVFITAGSHSYMLDIHILDNPYRLPRYRALWETGYKAAKRAFEPPKRIYLPTKYMPRRTK